MISQNFMPPLIWRLHKSARNLNIRLDAQKRALIITHPPSISRKQALNFLYEQADWVQNSLQKLPPTALQKGYIFLNGEEIRLFCHLLPHLEKKPPLLHDGQLHLYASNESFFPDILKRFLQNKAQEILPSSFTKQQEQLKIFAKKLTLRNVKSRWGSCSQNGHIMLNWRLIMAPHHVQDYVMIHELCHIKYFNHGEDFWRLVDNFHKNGTKERKKIEKWLKDYGITLLSCV